MLRQASIAAKKDYHLEVRRVQEERGVDRKQASQVVDAMPIAQRMEASAQALANYRTPEVMIELQDKAKLDRYGSALMFQRTDVNIALTSIEKLQRAPNDGNLRERARQAILADGLKTDALGAIASLAGSVKSVKLTEKLQKHKEDSLNTYSTFMTDMLNPDLKGYNPVPNPYRVYSNSGAAGIVETPVNSLPYMRRLGYGGDNIQSGDQARRVLGSCGLQGLQDDLVPSPNDRSAFVAAKRRLGQENPDWSQTERMVNSWLGTRSNL